MKNAIKKTALLAGGALAYLGWQNAASAESFPKPDSPFKGKTDVSRDKSVPAWPEVVKAPKGAPNVVLILLDDVGFGASSAMGGAIETPNLEKLAASGLRYNSFHVNAMCSPTRGALLSGRNNHQVGFGPITEQASGYPGYNSVWPKSSASIAEVLKENGYSTAAFGKWHNTPVWEVSPAGPFDRWPTGLGFEYFYGFLSASTSQWEPNLYRGTTAVEVSKPEQGYNLTNDLANDAIRWLNQHDAVAPDKPFFLYFASPGTHSPHHVPQEWVDKFKGKFDQGWDQLREETYARQKQSGVIPSDAANAARPAAIPAWDSLTDDQRKLVTRQQEIYAGFLAQTDHEVGRILDAIKAQGKSDNTLVLYIAGDNGATMAGNIHGTDARSPQGKPESAEVQLARADKLGSPAFRSNNYAAGWAYAQNTPFPWSKQIASHLGGITDPLIVSWPARIKDNGGIRGQFSHIVDIAPTIYEAVGIKAPASVNGIKQTKLEGSSLIHTFGNAKAKSKHNQQYFELVGNRGIYKDGWFAGRPFLLPMETATWEAASPDRNPWELYNLNEDFSQTRNLAAKNPRKLKEMVALFDKEAKRNNAYPIAPRRLLQPSPANGKSSFTYREGVSRLPLSVVPSLVGKPHTITADIEVVNGTEGVIYAEGGRHGGFSLYVKNGQLVYENNSLGFTHDKLVSSVPLPAGKVQVVFEYTPDLKKTANDLSRGSSITPGHGRLLVNGKPAGEAEFSWFGGFGETFDVGQDLASPVSDDYATPFAFTGKIDKVVLDLK